MRYFSLFSGIGGFELGINQAYESNTKQQHLSEEPQSEERSQGGFRSIGELIQKFRSPDRSAPLCVGFSEIDKYASQLYQQHFPEHKNYGDITNINAKELPDFDLLVGGFPCQSFSIAGLRRGFSDTRGTLFFDIARILQEKQPRLFLLENVKGLLSHDSGKTFSTIIATLDELGYDLQWQVLNSKDFGVPQNRERVFIVGNLRGTARPKVFPIGEGYEEPDREADKQGCANTLTGRSAGGQNRRGNFIRQLNKPKHSNDRIYGEDGIAPTLNTAQGGRRQPKIGVDIANALTPDAYLATGDRKRVEGKAVLTSMYERRIRRLTPLECERLQGFPENWTLGVSDTQRYKCLGNAVTVNVIEAIMSKLL